MKAGEIFSRTAGFAAASIKLCLSRKKHHRDRRRSQLAFRRSAQPNGAGKGIRLMLISDLPELATAAEISRVLRCTAKFVSQEMKTGRLRAFKIAGRYLASQQAVRDYIQGNQVCPDQTPARGSNGETTETNGKLCGTSEVSNAVKQQAREMVARLKNSSPRSSKRVPKQLDPPAPVTPIR